MNRPLTVAMVAGELSGDLLGRGLMDAIRKHHPDARFVGVGGPQMIAAGFESWYPMERLAVMGLFEVLGRIFELLRMRRDLVRRFVALRPDVFVGIDAPDFNLGLELQLRNAGLRTVHYVSPSVWAWRQGRVKKIRRAVDHMLTLLPFEAAFYVQHDVPVTFVGHPLADIVPQADQRAEARRHLGLHDDAVVLALLPGSRGSEVSMLLPSFLAALRILRTKRPQLECILPAATPERRMQIEAILAATEDAPVVTLLNGEARQAMAASDVVLLASGTATLEGMLAKRPMVAAYRFNALTAVLGRLLYRGRWFTLPNLLADEALVTEVLQEEVTPERLAAEVARWLDDPVAAEKVRARFAAMHADIRRDASTLAAEAVLAVAGRSAATGNASA